jgi:hypothetical protein
MNPSMLVFRNSGLLRSSSPGPRHQLQLDALWLFFESTDILKAILIRTNPQGASV